MVEMEPAVAAERALDDFIAALNRRDDEGVTAAFNFPHYRLASGAVSVFEKPGDYNFAYFDQHTRADGWHHTEWNRKKVIHAHETKVHFDVQFSRYRADGSLIAVYQSLWVVTNMNGHWGVQMRSSFAQ
jgi:hypothetical protein